MKGSQENMQEKSIARLGTVMFYIGGFVWIVFAACKYGLEWDVNVRQFLPFHLVAIIPGVLLRHGYPRLVRYLAGRVVGKPS
jgi:hypothetical protein